MVERRNSVWQSALRGSLESVELAHPAGQWVPSGEVWATNLRSRSWRRLPAMVPKARRRAITASERATAGKPPFVLFHRTF
jgi:hypothetical protein